MCNEVDQFIDMFHTKLETKQAVIRAMPKGCEEDDVADEAKLAVLSQVMHELMAYKAIDEEER